MDIVTRAEVPYDKSVQEIVQAVQLKLDESEFLITGYTLDVEEEEYGWEYRNVLYININATKGD